MKTPLDVRRVSLRNESARKKRRNHVSVREKQVGCAKDVKVLDRVFWVFCL